MDLTEYDYVYAPSPYGDRLVSYNGQTISYDSSGRTVVYRGKQITYLQADANKIAGIGNVSFTYDADGMRRSKTLNGVTHYYTYDGIRLVKSLIFIMYFSMYLINKSNSLIVQGEIK